jgi:transcriptional regulator with XRE-family HTH domain
MQKRTDGHRLLSAWMKANGVSLSAIGRECGISREAVSQWFGKNSCPDSANRIILHRIAGIEPDSWLSAQERKRIGSSTQGMTRA